MPNTASLKRKLLITLFIFLIVNVVLITLAGRIVQWGATHYLSTLGVEAQITAVQLDLLDSKVKLEGLKAQEQKQRLAVEQLTLDWQWQGVLSQSFLVDSIAVKGLRLDIAAKGGELQSIGGIDLVKLASRPDSDEPVDDKEPSVWQLTLGKVALSDFDVCYADSQSAFNHCVKWQDVQLDTSLLVSSDSSPKLTGGATIKALNVSDMLSLKSFAIGGLGFNDNQLRWQKIILDGVAAQPVAVGLEQLSLADGWFDVNTLDGELNRLQLTKANAQHQQYNLQLNAFSVDAIQSNAADVIRVTGVTLKQPVVLEQSELLLSTEQVSTTNLALHVADKQVEVTGLFVDTLLLRQKNSQGHFDDFLKLEKLSVIDVKAAEDSQIVNGFAASNIALMRDFTLDDGKPLISLNGVALDKVTAGKDIAIGQLEMSGLDANLEQTPEKGLNVANWLYRETPAQNDKEAGIEPQQTQADTAKSQISLQQLKLGQGSRLSFTEHSLGQAVRHDITDLMLDLSNLLIGEQMKPADIALKGKIQGSGELQAKGQLTPDANDPQVALTGQLNYLSLPAYSAYSARFIGHRIEQGQLNVAFKVNVADNKIDSNFDLLLNKFEIGDLEQFEQSPVNEKLGVPLSTALNLIRDSDDNIELSLPVKGDLAQPDFSVSGVLETVTLKALKTAVIYTYSPLGVLSVASDLVDLATALKFKPIAFEKTQLTLSDKAKQRLDKTARVLKDKQKVSLVLCANATKADLPPETVFSDELIPQLLDKANARQQAVKSYLVDNHGVEAHRLLSCNVKLDKKAQAQPVVRISI